MGARTLVVVAAKGARRVEARVWRAFPDAAPRSHACHRRVDARRALGVSLLVDAERLKV